MTPTHKLIILFLLVLAPFSNADPFDWDEKQIHTSELSFNTEQGVMKVMLGSMESGWAHQQIAAKLVYPNGKEITLFDEMASEQPRMKLEASQLVITKIFYPQGWDYGEKIDFCYRWNNSTQTLELIDKITTKVEIN